MKTLTLLAGAGALALAAAAAQAAEDNTAAEARANAPEPVERSYGEGARVNTAEGAPGLPEAGETSRETQRPAHTGRAQMFEDSGLAGNPVDPDSEEARIVREAMQGDRTLAADPYESDVMMSVHPDVWGEDSERADVSLLQAFLAVDTDENLLISRTEFTAWQGGEADAGAQFARADYDSSGELGFSEYRVWQRLTATEAADAPGS